MLKQLHVKVSAELLDVNPRLLSWNGRCHSRFGSPSGILSSGEREREKKTFSYHAQESTTVDNVHLFLRLFFGLILDVFASSIGNYPLKSFVCTRLRKPL